MKRNSKIVIIYAAVLLMSHVWTSVSENSENEPDLPGEARGKVLWVLFSQAGGYDRELAELERELVKDELAVVWRPPLGAGQPQVLDAVRAGIEESQARKVVFVGSGYGSIDAILLSESIPMNAKRAVVLVEPVLSTRFELLGDERLNTAMKAFQLAWFWVWENAVPHFGLSSKLPYRLDTARRVFDARQDLSGEAYRTTQAPVMVVFSQPVDPRIAKAYQQVNPRAERVVGTERNGALDRIIDWGQRDNQVTAREPSEASFDDFKGVQLSPLWGGFLLAIATFASEDFACIGGGLLAASGSLGLFTAVMGCLLGIFLGDLGIYFIGRFFGAAALQLPVLRLLVSGKSLNRSKGWFERRGVALVVLTRFFPGSRVPTYFAAGVVKVSWVRFAWALMVASSVWTPILVLASYRFGESFLAFFESIGAGGWLGIVAVILSFAIVARIVAKMITWKGRRLLYSKWRRLIAWEFWPMWAVYLPVIPQILWLVVRYRSVSLPFSVNPCMPASGLVYESKIQILEHLEKHGVPIARFKAIGLDLGLEEKMARLEAFMDELGLAYPIVLKPDIGQRGQGVVIVKNEDQARAFFEGQVEDTIAQEFIEGSEYGVFYQRYSNAESGEVTSITDKRTTSVIGDGRSTLEELILKDKRAVCMAAFFLSEYESELERIPAEGERFMLASIGTHSRGAVFLDGAELLTEELQSVVDAFSKGVEGFHFGRYDLRVPSAEHLKRGEGIRVIELNGITSEPTNMYDPKYGPLFGWTRLMRQWRAIFALAKENRLAGHEPVSKRYVIKLAIAHFKGSPSRSLS